MEIQAYGFEKKSQSSDLKKFLAVILFGMAKSMVSISCLAGILTHAKWKVIRKGDVEGYHLMSQNLCDW